MDKWYRVRVRVGVRVGVRVRAREYNFLLLLFLFFKHNHTPSGKKTVTGMQVVTTSQVQIIGCRSKAIL